VQRIATALDKPAEGLEGCLLLEERGSLLLNEHDGQKVKQAKSPVPIWKFSRAKRNRMAAAQRARWAKVEKAA
jgi:hypothetical protein